MGGDPFLLSAPVIAATTSSRLVVLDVEVGGAAPETQHDDPVGHLEDVGEVVADDHDTRGRARAGA